MKAPDILKFKSIRSTLSAAQVDPEIPEEEQKESNLSRSEAVRNDVNIFSVLANER